ncbi:MAG TPA: serine O-acetyltransferase EpsC [Dysgonamonadaceae bacterium]|nr:serine O-acetyltransferase EpsC [Dysgonamonadaceae bacterium]
MTDRITQLIQKFKPQSYNIPIDKIKLESIVEEFYHLMFPLTSKVDVELIHAKLVLLADVLLGAISKISSEKFATEVMEKFFADFPDIQKRLMQDAQCYFENDPAAKSIEEVILTYPGFFALSVHRIAHKLHQLRVPLIPRLFSEYAHSKVGIDIHPGAEIGENLFLDHGTGIVIGETTIVGNNVKIYQGVTLGALYLEKKLSSTKRHPTVEDNVVIYAGATILGGNTVIGRHSTIGGGAWLTKSVIPYSLVYNKVDVKIKTVKDFQEPNDFVI